MTQRQPTKLSLKNFFIYNVRYGTIEGQEEEKILYYHPNDSKMVEKLREVGLSEGIIQFTENFDSAECNALHTEKTRRVFLQPEKDFWMIMTLNVPYGPRSGDPMESYEYLGSDVDTTVYRAVLKQAYSSARLLTGPFQSILDAHDGDTTVLKEKLESFFRKFSLEQRLVDCDILNIFDGVQFLPLDRSTFLRCQCFTNLIEATFPIVSYSLLLYKDSLVWSGLGPDDVKVLFRFVCDHLPIHARVSYLAMLNSAGGSTQRRVHKDRFVTGPEGILEIKDNCPVVFLSKIPHPGFFHLIVYKVHHLVICLFIPRKEPLKSLCLKLDAFLFPRMTSLVDEIRSYRENLSDHTDVDSRYVYFNTMNLATKETLRSKRPNAATDALVRALVTLHKDNVSLQEEGVHSSETFMRNANDHWVVGRMSNFRVFYIVVEKKKLTLQEVDDVAKKICESQLQGIFFHV